MKIEGNGPVEGKSLYDKVNEVDRKKDTEKNGDTKKSGRDTDKISLSGRAKEISELKSLIERLPEIRTDRVEELKKAVDTGSYNIDSMKVAERILQEL